MDADKQYVVFRLEGQTYGAAISVVREVSPTVAVTRLPNTPPYVLGVIDLRGEVLPVIDLRLRLGLPAREPDKDTRLMVLSLGSRASAIMVDGVAQVMTVQPDQVVPPEAGLTVAGQDYVIGVAKTGEQLVVLLDVARLVD